MNRTAAINAVLDVVRTEPIVFTTGYASRIDRPNHFHLTGSPDLASSVAIGIAQQTGRPTVVVDGDGSLLTNPVGLVTAGGLPSLPLVHIVLDDHTSGQDVPASTADFGNLAIVCGYRRVLRVTDPATLVTVLRSELPVCTSTVFVHCVLFDADDPVTGRVDRNPDENAERLRGHLRELLAA